jgi:hypothetical protein
MRFQSVTSKVQYQLPGALPKTVFSELLTCSLGRVLEKTPGALPKTIFSEHPTHCLGRVLVKAPD